MAATSSGVARIPSASIMFPKFDKVTHKQLALFHSKPILLQLSQDFLSEGALAQLRQSLICRLCNT